MAVAAPARAPGHRAAAARPRRRAGAQRRRSSGSCSARRSARCRCTSRPATRDAQRRLPRRRHRARLDGEAACLRCASTRSRDTGRSSRTSARDGPAPGSRRRRPTRRSTPRRDPFLEGHEDRTPPELDALRPDGSAPDTPGWRVRVVPNLYPAVAADAPRPGPRGPRRPLHLGGRARAARGDREHAARGRPRCSTWSRRNLRPPMGMWRRRIAHHVQHGAACVHLFVNDGRAAGASQPHTHAQLVALDFVPAARRARARAVRRLRDDHDGRQPARRPRAEEVRLDAADRRDRRRGRRARAVRLGLALPAAAGAAHARDALRGRRARSAPRRCTTSWAASRGTSGTCRR